MIRFLPLLGKSWVYEIVQAVRQFEIVDLLNWIGPPIGFPLNMSFFFVAEVICANLRGGILRNQAERGETWTGHSPGGGSG